MGETNVMNVTQNTMDSLIVMLVVVMNMEPLMTSVPTKENVLAKITMLEISVTDALKDSLAFPTAKDALAMTKDQKAQSVTPLENVLAKLTSKATVVINASLLSMVSLIAKLVNVMPRDQSLLILAMRPENVLANPTLLETSVTNAQKVL